MNAGEQLAIKRFSALYGTPKPGIQGPIGPSGMPGMAGRATNTGATGADGPIGPTGVTGPAGTASNTGATGPIGYTGIQGPRGFTSGQVLYLNGSNTSGIYTIADTLPTKNNETTKIVSYLTDKKIHLASFVTSSSYIHTGVIPPGTFNFVLLAKLTGTPTPYGEVSTTIYAEIYKLSSTGVETLLLTSNKSNTIPVETLTQVVFDCTTVNMIPLVLTDKLVIKLYSYLINGDDNTELTVYYEDQNAVYSHIHTPLASMGPTGPVGMPGPKMKHSVSLIPNNISETDYRLNLTSEMEGCTFVLKTNSAISNLTVSVSSSLEADSCFYIKNYSNNDVNLLLSIDNNNAVPINSNLDLPLAVLNKYNNMNQPTSSLYWNGNTMMFV